MGKLISMGFIKSLKTKAYYKRYQTKFRRRREGKTDYRARRKMVTQDCNKYSTPKYRFVVRISNLRVTCQIVQAKMQGDEVLSCAYSSELPRYGIKCGLTNYAGCYATGLLLARRHLAKIGLADDYQGQSDVSSDDFEGLFKIEQEGENRPFKALMDVGIANTCTGARPFAAMKGACDGGIDIPTATTVSSAGTPRTLRRRVSSTLMCSVTTFWASTWLSTSRSTWRLTTSLTCSRRATPTSARTPLGRTPASSPATPPVTAVSRSPTSLSRTPVCTSSTTPSARTVSAKSWPP